MLSPLVCNLPEIPRARPLRVMVASPADVRCEHLQRLLAGSPRLEVVGRADGEARALRLYFEVRPDVTLLDWRVAANEPARFVGLLRRVAPDAKIISIVPSLDSMPARAARALGADVIATCRDLPSAVLRFAEEFEGAAQAAVAGRRPAAASSATPARIIGTHSHWAVDNPSDSVPKMPGSGVRKNSAAKRNVP